VVAASPVEREVWRLLAEVPDPEIPILNVIELGVVRYVRDEQERGIYVGVSPTYTGCPATEAIQASIKARLHEAGFESVRVDSVLAPAWTSDWLSDSAREKLREYGIAPPAESVDNPRRLFGEPTVQCPRCSSAQTQRVSEFGSTPCKALYRCTSCLEPFEYFKCI
jgi:ring-1,2-phenylacetyl-CoA epoxidase subunit PaaD